jgi:hypothetical protein
MIGFKYKNKILLHLIKMSLTLSASLSFKPSASKPSVSSKNYMSNGYTMNHNGYLANPTHSAQVAANNAGALTRAEAASMGLPLGGRR